MLRSKPHNIERMDVFINEDVVAIGWTATGSLKGATKEDIRESLKALGYEGQSLSTNLGMVNAFIRVMKPGDLVLIREGKIVHIGEVDEYSWEEKYVDMHMAHTRPVKWLTQVPFEELNASIQSLLKNIKTIARYPGTFEESELGKYLPEMNTNPEPSSTQALSEEKEKLMANTIEILKDLANNATDEKVRLEAAKELLSYLKNA